MITCEYWPYSVFYSGLITRWSLVQVQLAPLFKNHLKSSLKPLFPLYYLLNYLRDSPLLVHRWCSKLQQVTTRFVYFRYSIASKLISLNLNKNCSHSLPCLKSNKLQKHQKFDIKSYDFVLECTIYAPFDLLFQNDIPIKHTVSNISCYYRCGLQIRSCDLSALVIALIYRSDCVIRSNKNFRIPLRRVSYKSIKGSTHGLF